MGILVKFAPKPSFIPRSLKAYFGSEKESYEELLHCRCWRSRSGLNWDYCLVYHPKKDQFTCYRGLVKRLFTVAKFTPMTYEDLEKPIPRTGKNIVGIPVMNEVEDFFKHLAASIGERVIIFSNSDAIAILLFTPYDYIIPMAPFPVLHQSNLYIFPIDFIPAKLTALFNAKETTSFTLGNHDVGFLGFPSIVQPAYSTYDMVLFKVNRPMDVYIFHPEHKTVHGELQPGWYLAVHVTRGVND